MIRRLLLFSGIIMMLAGLLTFGMIDNVLAYDYRWYQPKFMASVDDAVITINQMLQKRSLTFYNGTDYTKIYEANVDHIGLRAFGAVNKIKTEQVWVPQGLFGGYYQVVQKPYQEEWRVSIDFAKIDAIDFTANGQTILIWTGDQTSYWGINTGMEQDARILADAVATLAVSSGSNLRSRLVGFNFATDKELKKLRKELNWKDPSNIIITEVAAGFPSEAASFRPKDIIVALNEVPVNDNDEFSATINKIIKEQSALAGDINIPIKVVRDGSILDVKCVIPNFNRGREGIAPLKPKATTTVPTGPQQPISLGVDLRALNESEQVKAKVNGGLLVIKVSDGGLAARSGIKANDILMEINGKPVKDIQQLKTILANETPNKFKVIRDGAELVLDAVFSI